MAEREYGRLRVLVANQLARRAKTVSEIARSLGHEVVGLELNVDQVAELTRKEHPDVALVGLGESSQHALELIEQIVRNAACPVILVFDARDQDFVNEAAKRGVFAYIVDGDKNQLQSALDIVLRRFAEYHNLEGAFGRRATIERAKGILMAVHGIDEQQAFELLRDQSQHRRTQARRHRRGRHPHPPPLDAATGLHRVGNLEDFLGSVAAADSRLLCVQRSRVPALARARGFFFSLGADGRERHEKPFAPRARAAARRDRIRRGRETAGGNPGGADVTIPRRLRLCLALVAGHRRMAAGIVFGGVTLLACILLGRRLTGSSWPLAHARLLLVAAAGVCYFFSFVVRARGWRRLFPRNECPGQARCLASVGAAAASGIVLPFRLDYLIKIGTLRRLGGIRISLEAIALSIISLGIVDAVAMLPLSISATATTSSGLRGPLLVVVAFGAGCCILLLASARLVRLPLLRRSRRLGTVAGHVSAHKEAAGRGSAIIAGVYLLACWTARALGSTLLLSALGLRFSPTIALCVLCLSAAAGVVPITAGGLAVNVGATAAILLTLGVGKDIAINFSLASGLLITSSAALAALSGAALSVATMALARRRATPRLAGLR